MKLSSPFEMNRQKNAMAAAFIVIGVVGRLLLIDVPNIETVMAMAILAGYFLGGVYMILVPLSIMAFSDFLIYGNIYAGQYTLQTILAMSAFTWTGFVFVSLIGRLSRRKVLKVVKSVAIVTGVSIPATIAYDLWTTLGGWYFIYKPLMGWSLAEALINLIPFMILHLISSLIFVPIFGTLFTLIHSHGWSVLKPVRLPGGSGDRRGVTGP